MKIPNKFTRITLLALAILVGTQALAVGSRQPPSGQSGYTDASDSSDRLFDSQNCTNSTVGHYRSHVHY
jgi:hypothetical protein